MTSSLSEQEWQPTPVSLRMECVCDLCRTVYQPWYADNDLWNAVMDPTRDREAFLCPTCFVNLAAAHRVAKVPRLSLRVDR